MKTAIFAIALIALIASTSASAWEEDYYEPLSWLPDRTPDYVTQDEMRSNNRKMHQEMELKRYNMQVDMELQRQIEVGQAENARLNREALEWKPFGQ